MKFWIVARRAGVVVLAVLLLIAVGGLVYKNMTVDCDYKAEALYRSPEGFSIPYSGCAEKNLFTGELSCPSSVSDHEMIEGSCVITKIQPAQSWP